MLFRSRLEQYAVLGSLSGDEPVNHLAITLAKIEMLKGSMVTIQLNKLQ